MFFRFLSFIACFVVCLSCNQKSILSYNKSVSKSNSLPLEGDLLKWHHKDIENDSIAGISLYKAYDYLKSKEAENIIVAILDTELNIDNSAIKNQIWINHNEIPNNGIDDDHNGYIDDIHGWNFLNTSIDQGLPSARYGFSRYVQAYEKQFLGKNISEIHKDSLQQFKQFEKAQTYLKNSIEESQSELSRYKNLLNKLIATNKVMDSVFSRREVTKKKLDSLLQIITDTVIIKHIDFKKLLLKYEINEDYYHYKIDELNTELAEQLNINHVGRLSNDNINDITDIQYGNNNVKGIGQINHALRISSLIAANRIDSDSVQGILNNVKIMPLNIMSYNGVHDKDIALAIRYAVDNGAKIINMSFSISFPVHEEWLKESMLYAMEHDVLLITSSGNYGENLDYELDFLNDSSADTKEEFANNFMKVGASSYKVDSTLIANFSNYGKEEVDIFAPGNDLYTIHGNYIEKDLGTSLSSAITTGIAALIRSHYPNLTAAEVKQIIMKSGVSYDIMVNKPSTSKEKELVPFSSLSKSGKIVNAYNALLMAEEVSKKKKKRK
ncbi:S8 family serine peptidase [Kordia sp.]|uniref:S8 family serine peptidase n=1 Tax=Kordia sp. TaxID=1965332 RepID=UPI003B59CA34